MQPVQIGMNAVVVLVILLLAVPAQLFLSHYMEQMTASEEGEEVSHTRQDSIERLGSLAHDLVEKLRGTASYYSSWTNLKELVLIPYKKKNQQTTIHLQSTVINSGRGVTTILLQPADSSKDKSSSGSSEGGGGGGGGGGGERSGRGESFSESSGRTKTSGETSKSKHGDEGETRKVAEEPTSPATEVLEHLKKEVYFAQSKKPREPKPSSVKLSVGQVVRHKQDQYYGVLVGWDEEAKAPDQWIEKYYSRRKHIVGTPHYLVLVDSHYDASGTPFHYIPQEDLEVVTNKQVQCPEIADFFEGFTRGRHIPKPWLRTRYPRD